MPNHFNFKSLIDGLFLTNRTKEIWIRQKEELVVNSYKLSILFTSRPPLFITLMTQIYKPLFYSSKEKHLIGFVQISISISILKQKGQYFGHPGAGNQVYQKSDPTLPRLLWHILHENCWYTLSLYRILNKVNDV